MNVLKILIIDDEPLAHKVLESHCSKLEYVSIIGHCYDGISALNFLKDCEVDLMLLDIQMPDLTGLELLDGLKDHAIKVILTTAFSEYAIDGFNYDQVVDYLHKPIRISRFIKAIERTQKMLLMERQFQQIPDSIPDKSLPIADDSIMIIENKMIFRVKFDDIMHIQSWGNYLKFFLVGQQIKIIRKTLKELEEELPERCFQRTHKSYIVNIKQILAIEGNMLILKEHKLTIGKSYSALIKKRFLKLSHK